MLKITITKTNMQICFYKSYRMSLCLCVSILHQKILLTVGPIWLSFAVRLLIGVEKIFIYIFLENCLHDAMHDFFQYDREPVLIQRILIGFEATVENNFSFFVRPTYSPSLTKKKCRALYIDFYLCSLTLYWWEIKKIIV